MVFFVMVRITRRLLRAQAKRHFKDSVRAGQVKCNERWVPPELLLTQALFQG